MTVPRAVQRYFECINGEDWDGLREILAPDVELRPVGVPPRHGVEAAVDYYATLLAGFPAHDDQPTRFLVSGDSVTVEIHYEGRTTSGVPVAFDAVDVFDLEDGRIQRISIWYDTHDVRRQVATG
jgi:ketosteroid isomerase-like protein